MCVDSWVDVQGGEGKLVHNRSKEELEKLIASAVSEEEPEMSDSDTMYIVCVCVCIGICICLWFTVIIHALFI